jgi:hypothetical protein
MYVLRLLTRILSVSEEIRSAKRMKIFKISYGFILLQALLLPFNRSVKRLAKVKINVHG